MGNIQRQFIKGEIMFVEVGDSQTDKTWMEEICDECKNFVVGCTCFDPHEESVKNGTFR